MSWVWDTLGVEAGSDAAAIRRAYARRLKDAHPEDDPDGFQRLRQAYEMAMGHVARRQPMGEPPAVHPPKAPEPEPEPEPEPKAARVPRPDPGPRPVDLARNRIQALAASGAADEASAREALAALLACREMEDVDAYSQAEAWVAGLILANVPASDSLAKVAVEVFRWTPDRQKGWDGRLIQGVLGRCEDIRFMAGIDNPSHPHHRAFAALRRPPTRRRRWGGRLTPKLAGEVEVMLGDIRRNRGGLLRELDDQAVAYWDGVFAKPRLSAWALWLMIALPLCCMAAVAASPRGSWAAVPIAYAVSLAAAAILVFGHFYAIVLPRRAWMTSRRWKSPAWLRLGWAIGGLLPLFIAAVLPGSAWSVAAVSLISAAMIAWALITGDPDRRDGRQPWPVRALIVQVLLIVWWLLMAEDLSGRHATAMSIAFAGAVFVSMAGAGALLNAWLAVERRARTAVLAALAVAVLAVAGALFEAGAPGVRQIAVAGVVAVVLLHRPIAAALGNEALRVRYYVTLAAAVVGAMIAGGQHLPATSVGGGFGLLAGVVVVIAASLRERRAA